MRSVQMHWSKFTGNHVSMRRPNGQIPSTEAEYWESTVQRVRWHECEYDMNDVCSETMQNVRWDSVCVGSESGSLSLCLLSLFLSISLFDYHRPDHTSE